MSLDKLEKMTDTGPVLSEATNEGRTKLSSASEKRVLRVRPLGQFAAG